MTTTTATKEAAAALASALPGKVSYAGDSEYQHAQETYFTLQNSELRPLCHVAPTSSEDVAVAVQTLAGFKDAQFAVRGGGHTLNARTANLDGGVVINLRSLNSVKVSGKRDLVSIGGGATWVEVYKHLNAQGLCTSGGRVADVGVGGLTTGGGISFFSAQHGFACDNVENFEVVTADGEIISANRHENTDLWWALKGGSGSNFGVVTRFDIVAFEQGKFLGGIIVSDDSTQDKQLANYGKFIEEIDPYTAMMFSIVWNQTQKSGFVLANPEYTKEGVDDPPCFRPFREISPKLSDSMRIGHLWEFTEEAGSGRRGLRNQFATTTFAGGFPMVKTSHQLWKASIKSVSDIKGMNWAMTVQPIPPSYSARTAERGGNALGLDPSDEPLTLFLISYSYDEKTDDGQAAAAAKRLIEDIDDAARKAGVFRKFKYLNYSAYWQDPFAGYEEEDLKKLRTTARKYDPEGMFQKGCPGGFKLFGSS